MTALLLIAQVIGGNGCPSWVPDWWCWITVSVGTTLKLGAIWLLGIAARFPVLVDVVWLGALFALISWNERALAARRGAR